MKSSYDVNWGCIKEMLNIMDIKLKSLMECTNVN